MLARTWLDTHCLRQLILFPSGRLHFALANVHFSFHMRCYNSVMTYSDVKCQVPTWNLLFLRTWIVQIQEFQLGSSEPGTPQWRSIWSRYTGTNNVIMFLVRLLIGSGAKVRVCVSDWGWGWGSHQKTLSSETRTRFWKVQSGTLTPCLAAPCLRQSNTPSHVVCCHGSRDPSHSVCKNIVLVSHPPDQLPLPFQKQLPLQKSLKSFFFLFFFLTKVMCFVIEGLAG